MVHRADQTVTDPYERLEGRIRKLESQLREERAARRLESASIGKGGITVKDGGALRVIDETGTVIAQIGDLSTAKDPGARGIWLQRAGGGPAFGVYGTGPGDEGFIGMYDRSSNYVFTDDAASGRGVARPYLHLMVGEISPPTATTTATTFGDLAAGAVTIQHPVLYAYLLVRSSDASTTGEVRMALDGAAIGPTLTVTANMYAITPIGPFRVTNPGPYGQIRSLSVQARRTGTGTGTIGVRALSILGLESSYA